MNSSYLDGHYDLGLVALSYVVASFAGYSAIDIAHRIHRNPEREWLWIALGALAMGTGIWSMHFIGMQAFSLPIELGYDLATTLVSLIAAIVVAALALYVSSRRQMGLKAVVVGAALMGSGICVMHYTGMYAMKMQPGIDWNAPLFVASVAIAVAASGAALWIVFRLRRITDGRQIPARLVAAAIMGLAVVGMHYTGMAAAHFPVGSICRATGSLTGAWTAGPVTAFTVLMSLLIMGLAAYDSRVQAQLREERLRRAQDERARILALHDPDTMLRNRASFQQEAVNFIQRCSRTHAKFDLFYGALRFPDLNGRENDAMKIIAERLRPLARPHDFLARYGKTEFALLRMRDPMEGAPQLLQDQLLSACTMPLELGGQRLSAQAHVGCGTFPDQGQTSRQLLMAAARSSTPTLSSAALRAQAIKPVAAA
ncbi:MHYT domain-containing protein [Solimonas soli]|uniref:MHYT domain-containing protein n=1 Tax=Solimonas soli TaxID=413479 RepID=UPI0004BC9C5B|nr:MHYT domain-containing protein [Solimonas soli]